MEVTSEIIVELVEKLREQDTRDFVPTDREHVKELVEELTGRDAREFFISTDQELYEANDISEYFLDPYDKLLSQTQILIILTELGKLNYDDSKMMRIIQALRKPINEASRDMIESMINGEYEGNTFFATLNLLINFKDIICKNYPFVEKVVKWIYSPLNYIINFVKEKGHSVKYNEFYGMMGRELVDSFHSIDNNISIVIGFLIGFKSHRFAKLIPIESVSANDDDDCVDKDERNYGDDAGSASLFY